MNVKLPFERWIAAPVLLASVLVLAGLLLAAALADLSSAIAERDAKAEFAIRSLPASRSGQAGDTGKTEAANLALAAESETLAAADLDTLVRSTFVDAGSAVMSSRTEAKHEDAGIAGKIEAQVVVEGPIEALQQALVRLENGTPLVLIDEISMQPVEASGMPGSEPQAPILHATLTLTAYWAASPR